MEIGGMLLLGFSIAAFCGCIAQELWEMYQDTFAEEPKTIHREWIYFNGSWYMVDR